MADGHGRHGNGQPSAADVRRAETSLVQGKTSSADVPVNVPSVFRVKTMQRIKYDANMLIVYLPLETMNVT